MKHLAVLLVLALVTVPATLAHHPGSAGEVDVQTGDAGVTWRAVAFHPDGTHALLAGSWSNGETTRDLLGRWTPADGLEILRNRTGPGLVDVAFHESGTSLVVGLQNTLLLGRPGSYENVWDRSEFAQQDLSFYGLRAAWAPREDVALVSGSSLLRMELDGELEVVHGGRGAFFRAVEWADTGSELTDYALVEAALERESSALLGTIWRTNGSPPLDQESNVAVYGKSSRGRALLNTVAFAPNGTFALLAGRDGAGASVLTWSALREACHMHEQDGKCHDHRWQYLPTDKREGPITCAAWHPSQGFALAVGMDHDVVGYAGTHIYAPVLHEGPDLFGCDYHPSGAYALAVGKNGTVAKITPGQTPLGAVVDPPPGALVPPQANETFRVGVLDRGGIRADVTGQVLGTEATVRSAQKGPWWELNVDTRELKDGVYDLEVTVEDSTGRSSFTHPFLVNNEAFTPQRPTMRAPEHLEGQGSDADGAFTIRWQPLDAPVVYEVREQRTDGGVNTTRTFQAGADPQLPVRVDQDGSYLYQVRAKNSFNQSAWSTAVRVHVVLDSDEDGVPDRQDPRPFVADTWGDADEDGFDDDIELKQCSDPQDANSTPATDDDGDGLRNGQECLQGTDPHDPNDPPDGPGQDGPGDEGNQTPPESGNGAPGLLAGLVVACLAGAALATRRA